MGAHLATYLDKLRDSGEERIANEIEDAAQHDEHDSYHEDEFVMDCWFCYNESKQPGLGWPFENVPKRIAPEAL